jgi:hypothetical protein
MKAGIETPWKSDKCFVIASGDDVVIWVVPELAERVRLTIMRLSSRNTEPQAIGLGQCIKEISIGSFWQVGFCSKISIAPDGTFKTWTMFRDVRKLL